MDRVGESSLIHGATMTRALDVTVALLSLLLLSPVLILVAVAVKLSSPGSVLFGQERVGRGQVSFRLLKFRSMSSGPAGAGDLVTGRDDPRVTPLGRFLRRTKLDEVPQLWNVLRGEMSLVGPRPEVPRYVAYFTDAQRAVFSARPGLTDPATLQFRDEEDLLARVPPEERERYYLDHVLPAKLDINLKYLKRRSFWSDLGVLGRTLLALLRLPSPKAEKP